MAFFAVEPLTLMISSRCADEVEYGGRPQPMSAVRRAMKSALEEVRFGGEQVFRVWIHEDEAVTPGDRNSWDTCMRHARQADVFLVLYNGNAGWPGTSERLGDHVGICHAEFEMAYNKTPGKVRSVQFPEIEAAPDSPNGRFQPLPAREVRSTRRVVPGRRRRVRGAGAAQGPQVPERAKGLCKRIRYAVEPFVGAVVRGFPTRKSGAGADAGRPGHRRTCRHFPSPGGTGCPRRVSRGITRHSKLFPSPGRARRPGGDGRGGDRTGPAGGRRRAAGSRAGGRRRGVQGRLLRRRGAGSGPAWTIRSAARSRPTRSSPFSRSARPIASHRACPQTSP